MKRVPRLTDLEVKIMRVMWESNKSMTIQNMAESLKKEKISAASITQAMQRMVAKKAVKVDNHVLVSSVYARAFRPSFSQEEFLAAEFKRLQKSIFGTRKISREVVMAALFDADGDEIEAEEAEALQRIIDAKKNQLIVEEQ